VREERHALFQGRAGFSAPLSCINGCSILMGMKDANSTLEMLVEPVVRALTPEVARALTELRADSRLQARMDKLAEKANEGKLTPEELEEYETSIRFANYLAILQAKARRRLAASDQR
jgi:hypothetical protein